MLGPDGTLYRYSPQGKEPIDRVAISETMLATETYDYVHIFDEATPADMPSDAALIDLGDTMRPRPASHSEAYDCNADDADGVIPAGYTYLGQFIVHDMTYLDPVTASRNLRSPALDLDSVLPEIDPDQFISKIPELGPASLGLTSSQEDVRLTEDLRRDDEVYGKPIIADDRNDNFLPLSQSHLLLLKFYNAIAALLGIRWTPDLKPDDHRRVREVWVKHFQYAVLHDYLPRIVGSETYRAVLQGKRAIVHPESFPRGAARQQCDDDPWMPLEFATAFGRYGHSMIRHCYKPWNQKRVDEAVTVGDFMNVSYRNSGDCLSSSGRAIPASWIHDWFYLLDFSGIKGAPAGQKPIMANLLDTNLAAPLGALPKRLLDNPGQPDPPCPLPPSGDFNLAARTLMRVSWCHLKPAQDALKILNAHLTAIKAPPIDALTPHEICDATRTGEAAVFKRHPELLEKTPLWFYMLREAEKKACGRHLGPFGGRIVMETMHAAIEASSCSILDGTGWKPTLPRALCDQFTFADLVAFSGNPDPLGGP